MDIKTISYQIKDNETPDDILIAMLNVQIRRFLEAGFKEITTTTSTQIIDGNKRNAINMTFLKK